MLSVKEEFHRKKNMKKKRTTIFDLKKSQNINGDQTDNQSTTYISNYKPSKGVEEFYQQLSTNREYLSNLDLKLDGIYERETYRNYLNERYLENLLCKAEKHQRKII